MKLNTFFTFCLALACQTSFSQSYFPSASDLPKWEYVTKSFFGGFCEKRIIKTGNSLSICNQTMTEIWDCDANEQNCLLQGYYRVSNDSVFLRRVNDVQPTVNCSVPEILTYAFNVAVNDSMAGSVNLNDDAFFVPTQIATVNYLGTDRPTLQMNYNYWGNNPTIISQMTWIEGVGSTIHPFYPLTAIGDNFEIDQAMVKLSLNGTVIYEVANPFNCNGWLANENKKNEHTRLSAYPNPVQNQLTITAQNGGSDNLFSLVIYDMLGKICFQKSDYQLNQALDIETLPKGIYQLEITSKTDKQILKFVKS